MRCGGRQACIRRALKAADDACGIGIRILVGALKVGGGDSR